VQERCNETGVGVTIEVAAQQERAETTMMETTMTETMTMEKKTTKKSIPNLISAHPRAEMAP
jgi:hypothetical protein